MLSPQAPLVDHADLEISLRRYDVARYIMDLRFSQPSSDADNQPLQTLRPLITIDSVELRALTLNPDAYGMALSASLFADPAVRAAYARARGIAGGFGLPLHLRLAIDVGAPELHALRWELLCDPEDQTPVSLSSHVLFSRYLASSDWRPVHSRARGTLRALTVIASPANLARFSPGGVPLSPIDTAAERARAETALAGIGTITLADPGQATLPAIADALWEGIDILYLVAHGALNEGTPQLWLEAADGSASITHADDLVMLLRTLPSCPRLAILISCQSAGTGGEDALEALGPRLTEAGIPAVVAMQGNLSMETAAVFAPRLVKELLSDGKIDKAVATARAAVGRASDAWMPVLFSRLKSGRLWYIPGFTGPGSFGKWPAIANNILKGRCTPILGPALLEPILGSTHTIARNWAETYGFPLGPHEREDLPQVAQFLSVKLDNTFPRDQLARFLRQSIVTRFSAQLPPELRDANPGTLNSLIEAVGALRRTYDPGEPHQVLASLPFAIYLTTNPDSLLESALRAADREPQVALCPWNEDVEQRLDSADKEPTEYHPLVYHLFGALSEPYSVVLTEDDYFDFLIGVTSRNNLIPDTVRNVLADSALLFLGFQLDDWSFRVLFRSLMAQEGRSRRRRYAHVAVQITPDEGRIIAPAQARQYLESYFQDADISIYWGSSEEFLRELRDQMALLG